MLPQPMYGGLGMDTHPPPLERERVSPQGGRRENQLSSNSWPLSEPGPRMEGDCWCRVGVVSAESRNVVRPPPQKKSIKSPGALAPPAPAPSTKKCKTLSQKGGLRGALSLGSRGQSLALPCPGHRVRRGWALGHGALRGGPRPARAQAGPCHAGAQQAPPPHTPTPNSGLPPPTACPCPWL